MHLEAIIQPSDFDIPKERVEQSTPTIPKSKTGFLPIESDSLPQKKTVNIWTREKIDSMRPT